MPKTKNIFVEGIMDKETNRAFIKQGFFRNSECLRFHSNGGDDGIAVNIKGTQEVADETTTLGAQKISVNFKCVGGYYNEDNNCIYYFLATSDGSISKICEYNIYTGNSEVVAQDNQSILNLQKNGYITGINEINGLLFFSEWDNNPRRINVERAKTWGLNGFTEDDLMVAVKPPSNKLSITLEDSGGDENYIEDKMLAFSYRYRYLDGEYSALAPFTNFAFEPKNFNYDFSEQSNRTMINKYNAVKIDFNTGNERVVEIQLVFKESESNSEWIIGDFNKTDLGYGNNETQSFTFTNNKRYRALSDNVLPKLYDNVPKTAKCQSIIDGRLMYAHYKENYDLVDDQDEKIVIDYSLELEANANTILVDGELVPSLIPLPTAKSDRSYEVGIVYADDHGRSTIILVSKDNTIEVPVSNSATQNRIRVTLNHKPPKWATKYRFFIKPNKTKYDAILPTLFYNDGAYRWVKLEGADKDKIKEGDFLVVKSDTQGALSSRVTTKVLEIKSQDKNFLQPEDQTSSIQEISGLYFKIKPKGYRFDVDDFSNFFLETYDSSRREYNNPVRNLSSEISKAHFYGDTLNDITVSGSYTGSENQRHRYLIRIDGTGGGADTFRWSDDDGANWNAMGVSITGGVQALSNGVSIKFDNTTGHSTVDEWQINARAIFDVQGDSKAYGFFRTVNNHTQTLADEEDEIIRNGARINFTYDEYNEADHFFDLNVTSAEQYDNIQEWFWRENIYQQIAAIDPSISLGQIFFVRGNLFYDDNATQITQSSDGTMTMLIRSVGTQNSGADKRVKIRSTSVVFQSKDDSVVVLETEGQDAPAEQFFEIGKTYDISNGNHIADTSLFPADQNQIIGSQPLIITLDWFNAFSYGNTVESYKIRDEFNAKGLDTGIRTLATIKDEYKEITRKSDVTWSDIYEDELGFNGLSSFNLSLSNFVKLDKEEGAISKIFNSNGDLLVIQENDIGILPYNKSVIYDVQGEQRVGISTNILDKKSFRSYASGKYGSKNAESFTAWGNRKYIVDQARGVLIRISNDGITPLSDYLGRNWFSKVMDNNQGNLMVGSFDPLTEEYLLNLTVPSDSVILKIAKEATKTLAFKDKDNGKGFCTIFPYVPDFMLHADNKLFSWKNGVMYQHNVSSTRNNFYGKQYASKISFFVNVDHSIEKIWKAMGIESNEPWDVSIKTKLTGRNIDKTEFSQFEDYWYAAIRGNTNGNIKAESVFGLGKFPIVAGVITLDTSKYASIAIGDYIMTPPSGTSKLTDQVIVTPQLITNITPNSITLENKISKNSAFLVYKKNQNIDGGSIRGDILEVEMTNRSTSKVELRAVNFEVEQSEMT